MIPGEWTLSESYSSNYWNKNSKSQLKNNLNFIPLRDAIVFPSFIRSRNGFLLIKNRTYTILSQILLKYIHWKTSFDVVYLLISFILIIKFDWMSFNESVFCNSCFLVITNSVYNEQLWLVPSMFAINEFHVIKFDWGNGELLELRLLETGFLSRFQLNP